MKQAVQALGWASNIFWIILLFFTVTVVYSAFQIRPGLGEEPSTSTLGGTMTFSLPFYLYNGGFYNISGLTITTLIRDENSALISDSSTPPQFIRRGTNVSITHRISISISQMTTETLSYLLFNDSIFNAEIGLKLNYAKAVPFKVSINRTMDWGAPLSNLTLGTPTPTRTGAVVPLSFENHSYFELNGTITLELVNIANQVVGEGNTNINVQPQSRYRTGVDVSISGDPTNIRARLYIQTSVFNYGPLVISLV